ncbi:hypothetical protein CLV98_1354 [Dyadobacter jejuensis]|uniref:Nucleic acid-binding protein n=1 Tax=Dyadobacter jejuensis TaxID=1082580 RepID=A0A316A4Y8_9BACT|nr:hypothetical protein [Dyadobacter jejuensis]PWJ52623.1 hypothetical protein CLV98_1354 [Dyadobacter jejuensis]
MTSSNQAILIDADVIIHFCNGGRISLLKIIFGNSLFVVPEVISELDVKPNSRIALENMLTFKQVQIYEVPTNLKLQILKEYNRIRRDLRGGMGESMCMAIAKFDNKILASSNTKDIHDYCKENSIKYYTTLDILYMAFQEKHINESEFDCFIYDVTSKGSHLFCKTLADYKSKKGIT